MISNTKNLKEASSKAKQHILELQRKYQACKQWDYALMERDVQEAYRALKEAWTKGVGLASVREFLSDNAYRLLEGNSAWADIKCFDLLECFDSKLEDIAIVNVINIPGNEDKFTVLLDHGGANDRKDQLADDFAYLDELPSMFGVSLSSLAKPISSSISKHDCWTFKWDEESQRWILDFIACDSPVNSYLEVLSNS